MPTRKEKAKVLEQSMEPIDGVEDPTLLESVLTILGYVFLLLRGHVLELCWKFGFRRVASADEPKNTQNFVPLLHTFESFYKRQVYRPIRDCYNRPVYSVAGAEIDVLDRVSDDHCWSFRDGGKIRHSINMGSYNYLGFAERFGQCAETAERMIRANGIAPCSSRQELGSIASARELERLVARYLGQEDAMVFQMGFATNALNLPAIANKHCCVISDELAHASLVLGVRLSGATVRVFRHNDMVELERLLQEAIVVGHPRTRRPFKKLIIVCEGIYSMEGTMVDLPGVIRLKNKYKAYLYMDEAHSIGAIGPHARGVVDYYGCAYTDVDMMMGTFTKSFGAAGGYIAGSSRLIRYLRLRSHAGAYGASMSEPVVAQISSALRSLFDESNLDANGVPQPTPDGKRRIDRLAWNTRYMRRKLREARLLVCGHRDSPVIPIMLFSVPRIACFSRLLFERGIAMVIAAWPATRVLHARARLCISASHCKSMLDDVLKEILWAAGCVNAPHTRIQRTVPSESDPDFYASYLSLCDDSVTNGASTVKNGAANGDAHKAGQNGHAVSC